MLSDYLIVLVHPQRWHVQKGQKRISLFVSSSLNDTLSPKALTGTTRWCDSNSNSCWHQSKQNVNFWLTRRRRLFCHSRTTQTFKRDQNFFYGPRVGLAPDIGRDRACGTACLHVYYYSYQLNYPEHKFKRRFWLSSVISEILKTKLMEIFDYFKHCKDATGKPELTAIQNCTATISQLA